MPFLDFFHQVAARRPLSAAEAEEAMSLVLSGQATTAQIAAFLTALRMKGETADEIFGFAKAMRSKVTHVDGGDPATLLDTCGTGGDGGRTFNISTVTAFVVAGAGVRVAKHGNRSLSSACGSADILEALGVHIALTPDQMGASIREAGIGFLFAPALHPAMKYAQPARAEIKMRTAFNLLGPLANPARASRQLIGAPSPEAAALIAGALARFHPLCAYVVHGADGLDEITTTAPPSVWEIAGETVTQFEIIPAQFGVPYASLDDLKGGGPEQNAAIARAILSGEKGPRRDIVLVNAALALIAAGASNSYLGAMRLAAESIDSGAARDALERLARFTSARREAVSVSAPAAAQPSGS
jgi:anthranilate phosphoribosyltransferase